MTIYHKKVVEKYDLAIIGGGILGTSISYWLSVLYNLKICVIDKEKAVAMHTSSRNTGVVHSPFYLDPRERKISATSSLISHDLWEVLSKRKEIPWMPVGTIEVAIDEKQHKTLEKYLKWGMDNGIPEEQLELCGSSDILKKEPNLHCYSGLYCSRDVSTDYGIFTTELKNESEKNGTKFLFNHKVEKVKVNSDVTLTFSDNSFLLAKFVVNCAGGSSLDIAKKFGLAEQYEALHFRGEYWIAGRQFADLVKTNIYSVARFQEFPFLDPHWIKRANGQTEIGPNAVPVASPETYEGYVDELSIAVSKLREILKGNIRRLLINPEFLRLISREFLSSVSKSAMVHRVQQFIPSIKPEYFIEHGTAGIRTPIITPEGTFLPQILELTGNNSFHIINYNSPGATGAPAYAAFVVKQLQDHGFLDYSRSPKDSIWSFDHVSSQF